MNKDTETLMAQVYKDFPIYKFLGRLKKEEQIVLPKEVIIKVCESYLKNKAHIENKWAYILITIKECWADYNAKQNIQESVELNKLSNCKNIRELVSNITRGV